MKKNMTKTICLAAAALLLTLGMTVGTAMAYFTTYAAADGGVTLDLGFTKTTIDEDVVNEKKEIVLKNTGDFDCYVRLKVLVGDAHKSEITYEEPGKEGKWAPGVEGYYYYSDILVPGGETTQLDVGFDLPDGKSEAFNVIIIQENTPVLYDDNGDPYADWSVKADVSQSIVK